MSYKCTNVNWGNYIIWSVGGAKVNADVPSWIQRLLPETT